MEDISSKKASICTEEKKTKTGIFFKKCVEESFCVNERERRRKEEFHSNTTAVYSPRRAYRKFTMERKSRETVEKSHKIMKSCMMIQLSIYRSLKPYQELQKPVQRQEQKPVQTALVAALKQRKKYPRKRATIYRSI